MLITGHVLLVFSYEFPFFFFNRLLSNLQMLYQQRTKSSSSNLVEMRNRAIDSVSDPEKIKNRVIQLFREAENVLPILQDQLNALANISQQKQVMESAIRRQQFVAESGTTSCVASSPLGVLSFFSSSMREQLVAQHLNDQASLVAAIFSAKQKWTDRVQKAAVQIEELEGALLSSAPLDYGVKCSTSSTNEMSDKKVRDLKDLSALHSILALMKKMDGTLQEAVLAIRKDFYELSAFGASNGNVFADALSFLLASDYSSVGAAGAQTIVFTSNAPQEENAQSALESKTHAARPAGHWNGENFTMYTFTEALKKLENFFSTLWELYRQSFLSPDALMLIS